MEISNNTLALFLIAAVAISVVGTFVSLDKLNTLSKLTATGFATSNSQATATLNISTTTSIKFSINSVDFGTGSVNTTGTYTNCTMTINESSAITKVGCIGFNDTNAAGDTFIIENDGGTDLNVTLNSTKTAATFIGGNASIVSFQYAVSNNETASGNSCAGTLGLVGWTEVNTSDRNICTNLTYLDGADTLRLGVRVVIPYDAISGAKTSTFTATGVGY